MGIDVPNATNAKFLFPSGLFPWIAALSIAPWMRQISTLFLLLSAWLPAWAGNIYFDLGIQDSVLSLTNRGDSTAFFPAVYRLRQDGHWELLSARPTQASLPPGSSMDWAWSERPSKEEIPPLEQLQPVMVRYYDQAGTAFGQITLFHPPPSLDGTKAAYRGNELEIEVPASAVITATWVLWAQEEGFAPITFRQDFSLKQPPAIKIDWRQNKGPVRLHTGSALPNVLLIHETSSEGLRVQAVASAGRQGSSHRAAWLDAGDKLGIAAVASGLAGLLLSLFGIFRHFNPKISTGEKT